MSRDVGATADDNSHIVHAEDLTPGQVIQLGSHTVCESEIIAFATQWDPQFFHVDGNAAEVHAADHYLRAVYVRAGEHEVVFTFDAARVLWPRHVSLVALAAIAWLLLRGRRRP